jgi:hypothetical protein
MEAIAWHMSVNCLKRTAALVTKEHYKEEEPGTTSDLCIHYASTAAHKDHAMKIARDLNHQAMCARILRPCMRKCPAKYILPPFQSANLSTGTFLSFAD